MGQALVIGVATKLYIHKQERYTKYTKDDILEDLKNCLNLELYNITETEKELVLSIKNEVFVGNIYNFLLNEICELEWEGENKEKLNNFLNKISKLKQTEEIEKLIKEEGSSYLYIITGCPWEDISYICDGKFTIIPTLLTYTFSYKVFMECYGDTFRYLRKKLQKSINNPLKDDVFLMVKNSGIIEAIEEAEKEIGLSKRYTDLDEMWRDLVKED